MSRVAPLSLVVLGLLFVTEACGEAVDPSDGGGGASASSTSATVTSCDAGTLCDGACVDLAGDPENCGACGRTCVLLHGSATCSQGECALASCSQGWANCNDSIEDGCELEDTCVPGGACATQCGSTGGLVCADACAPQCAPPPEACNAIDDDCDGACDQGAISGCRVAVHRAFNGTSGYLLTLDLAEAQAWGLEAQNYFYLYADATADLRPYFRCAIAGTSSVFYTETIDCEGVGGLISTVGFIAPTPPAGAPTCGAIPLYQAGYAPYKWHLYTTSAPERDAALAAGWVDEGIAGNVWTSL